jgi:hypothetical protein
MVVNTSRPIAEVAREIHRSVLTRCRSLCVVLSALIPRLPVIGYIGNSGNIAGQRVTDRASVTDVSVTKGWGYSGTVTHRDHVCATTHRPTLLRMVGSMACARSGCPGCRGV